MGATRPGSSQSLNCTRLSFPLAFEERLAHDFPRKLQILERVGRAFALLVGFKFDAELLLRILAGADEYYLRPS